MVYDFAIIGGGVAGLSLAHFLKKKNANVCVVEAGSQLGGVISSKRIEGFLCESAAQSFQSNDAIAEILSDLALETISPQAAFSNKYIENSGDLFLAPRGLGSFFSTELLSIRAKIRTALELFVKKGELEDESVDDFIKRRFGAEFSKKLFAPLVHGIWAGDTTKLSMRSAFPRVWEMEKNYASVIKAGIAQAGGKKKVLSFKEGTQSLIDAIAQSLGDDRIILNTKVDSLQVFDDHVLLGNALKAKQIIIATDAIPAANLIRTVDLNLASSISKIKYSSLGLMHLAVDENTSFGAGFLSVGGRATLGALCSSNAFAGRAPDGKMLLTCFVGGASNPELADVRDKGIEEKVINEVSKTFKFKSSPKVINKVYWKNAIPNYELGHFKLQEMVEKFNQSPSRVKLFGSWLNGAGIGSIIENSKRFSKCLN